MSRRQYSFPEPSARISVSMYLELRGHLIETDPDGRKMYDWATHQIGMPQTAEKLAAEIIWIILCAGRSAQAARTIERKVWTAIDAGESAFTAFGYRKKAEAIDRAWRERQADYAAMRRVINDPEALIDWCGSIPFVGDDTKFQLARNLGADVCKPDIWLCRLSGIPDKPRLPLKVRYPVCTALCGHLSEGSGDRISAVDAMLWLGCNKGYLKVDADAGDVGIDLQISRKNALMA